MDAVLLWLNLLTLVLVVAAVGAYFYARASQRARLMARAVAEVRRRGDRVSGFGLRRVSGGVLHSLRRLGMMVPLLNTVQRAEATTKLVAAGFRSHYALFVLMALSLLTIVVLLALASWLGASFLDRHGVGAWIGMLVVVIYMGSLLPRLVLDRLVRRRQAAIRLSLPDALDLMVICTNAGLGLNAAIERVADEMEIVAPALADEFKLTATELRLSSDIESVLNGLSQRTGLEGMRTLVNTFLQARQYGTAITQALRILAKSERVARMMSLEEKAAKLSVKMTLPMMLFILPTVLIVSAGPAILGLIKAIASH